MIQNETGAPAYVPRRTIWQEIKNSIRGTDADYTKIGIKRAVLLLAVPMILELVMESTFAVADIYFVGKLGPSAVATVGLTETYLFILYSIGMGLAMAATAVVARRVGEKNESDAGKTAAQAILLAIIASIPFAIAGIFYSKELLILMGADAWAIEEGYRYTQWMLGCNAVIMLLFVINAVFRGAGDAATAMWVLFIANGVNIILDPILIFGWGIIPPMGIEGAAIATNIGRSIGVLVQIWMLVKGGKHLRLALNDFKIHLRILGNIFKTSLGGVGQNIIAMASWIFIMRILASVGSEAVAGSTIALRVMMFTMMPAFGFGNAASTLVGQNLGAGHPERAEAAVWKTGMYNMVFLVSVAVVYFFFNKQLIGLFTEDARVIEIGAEWLRILSYSYFVYGWWMVSVQAFNGAGDTKTPTLINLVFFWLIQIPLSYLLGIHWGWEHTGVFWAIFFSETSVGIFTLYLFTRGKWKQHKV